MARSLPHGHVAAVWAQAHALGLPELLGPAGRMRDIALALLVARVVRPASKVATRRWWTDTTLAADLGVADASRDEVYAALDWLASRQEHIEVRLAARHLSEGGRAYFKSTAILRIVRGISREGEREMDMFFPAGAGGGLVSLIRRTSEQLEKNVRLLLLGRS